MPLPTRVRIFCVLAACSGGLLAADVQAQAPARQQIAVVTSGGQCTYEVKGQPDPTRFEIVPRGQVQFQPRGGHLVKVTVLPNDAGIEGGEGVREMWVRNARPRYFPVRTSLNRSTEHEVVIECCQDQSRQSCAPDRLVRATPAGLTGHLGLGAPDGLQSGPSAELPLLEPRPPLLGPRMVVVE